MFFLVTYCLGVICDSCFQLYLKCGQHQRAVCTLENRLRSQVDVVTVEVLDLLVSVLMETKEYARALEHIERSQQSGKEIPIHLIIKAGMCQVHLGHLEKAKVCLHLSLANC